MKVRGLPHLAAALCLLAFVQAWSTTRDLSWPAFDVQYREMPQAQTAGAARPLAGFHLAWDRRAVL